MDHAPERDSSKRPANQRDIRRGSGSGEALDRAQSKVDVGRATLTLLKEGLVNTGSIGIDGQDRRCVRCVLKRQPSVSAANLKDTIVAQADEALDDPRFEALPRARPELRVRPHGLL